MDNRPATPGGDPLYEDLDPNTPVIVGVGAADQRFEDPDQGLDVVDLMAAAARAAEQDASAAPGLLAGLDWIAATKGNPRLEDPAGLVAARIGATGARRVLSDIGILQTTPLARAASLIASGEIATAMVIGGETKWRSLRAQIAGVDLPWPAEAPEAAPDEHWTADGDILHRVEVACGLVHPVQQYAMVENSLRAADGQSIEDHVAELGALYAAMSEVAAANPRAAYPAARSPAFIATPGPDNRPLAFPYNKWHNAQWNVDQAAAIVFCSVERARALGVPESKWVFPVAVIENNHMTPLVERAEPHRCVGFEEAADELYRVTGLGPDDLGAVELYSCFPVAVRLQQRALGLDPGRAVTVTGGMAFAGGPLNNFVYQAVVALVERARAGEGPVLVSAVSGILTKQGYALYSAAPPSTSFVHGDVSDHVASATPIVAVGDGRQGTVTSYTVIYSGEDITGMAAVIDVGGKRTVAVCNDAGVAARFLTEEATGIDVLVGSDQSFTLQSPT